MIKQNRQSKKLKICAYCGGKIVSSDRIRVQVNCYKYRDSGSGTNPVVLLTKNYHKKCYIERYKDYERMKENESKC